MGKFYKRSDVVSFFGENTSASYYDRMTGFTELTPSSNATTYDRQYVDEVSERSETVGYAPEVSYNFDRETGNTIHTYIADATDDEVIGKTCAIVTVDFNQAVQGQTNTYVARRRIWSINPDSQADSTDAYTYSGSFKSNGVLEKGTAVATFGTAGDTSTVSKVTFSAGSTPSPSAEPSSSPN